ncbi:MAG TPA: outer membrane beta-barrel protein [Candidatus Angelobacter sp.]|nr:outer membrane beta-barrel protein [Candidatus Angelobacter sp.]
MFKKTAILLGAILACSLLAAAQEVRQEVTVSATGLFTANSSSPLLVQRATETGGILAGYRYNFNHWASVEANYGWNRNSQVYFALGFGENRVQSNVNQWTADFVAHTPTWRHLRPYVLGGGGAFVFRPTHSFLALSDAQGVRTITPVGTNAQGTFVYGGGADFDMVTREAGRPGISLRLGYRGYAYKVPNFGFARLQLNSWTHASQPEAGLTFRF